MTDERIGDVLLSAIRALPPGSGIIFRHHATPPAARRALYEEVRRIARARRIVLLLAGSPRLARGWRADGAHGRHHGITSAPVHDRPELIAAQRRGARIILVSPVFATTSHPGTRALGRLKFADIARRARVPVVALGGMDAQRARSFACLGIYGWAGIDALTVQKRKAVPT